MKKILKIIAIIIVLIALLLLMAALIKYLKGPNILGHLFGASSWLGELSVQGIIALAAVGLVIAAIISPKGFSKAMDRVTSAVSTVGSKAATMITKGLGSTLGGALKGLFTGANWLWIGVAATGAYLLWPSGRSERSYSTLAATQDKYDDVVLDLEHKKKSSS